MGFTLAPFLGSSGSPDAEVGENAGPQRLRVKGAAGSAAGGLPLMRRKALLGGASVRWDERRR